jgi:ribosomal protein S18 acetylase RimI-like enzyme
MAQVRRATLADHEHIYALWEEARLRTVDLREWDTLLASPAAIVLVAEEEGAVEGAIVASFDGWRAYIYHVAVSPRHRREGVGHDLMEEAEQYLVSAGARFVYVMVHEENTEGLALVGANGYLPDGDLVLTKPLASRA